MGRRPWHRLLLLPDSFRDLNTTCSADGCSEPSGRDCTSVLRPDGSALTISRLFLSLHVEQVLLSLPRKIAVVLWLLMSLVFTPLLRQRNHLIHRRRKTSSGQQPGAASSVAIQLSSTKSGMSRYARRRMSRREQGQARSQTDCVASWKKYFADPGA